MEKTMPEASFNRVTLLGRLTRDPEIRSTSTGDRVASLSVATTDTWRDGDGQRQEKPQFHPVVIWNQALIEATVPHLKKGSRVLVEGSLEHRSYETDQSTRYVTEVVLRQFNGSIAMLDRAPARPADEARQDRRSAGPSGRR
jgi:single-strand DNA-binding protein